MKSYAEVGFGVSTLILTNVTRPSPHQHNHALRIQDTIHPATGVRRRGGRTEGDRLSRQILSVTVEDNPPIDDTVTELSKAATLKTRSKSVRLCNSVPMAVFPLLSSRYCLSRRRCSQAEEHPGNGGGSRGCILRQCYLSEDLGRNKRDQVLTDLAVSTLHAGQDVTWSIPPSMRMTRISLTCGS